MYLRTEKEQSSKNQVIILSMSILSMSRIMNSPTASWKGTTMTTKSYIIFREMRRSPTDWE